ncbi:MAG TPA: hypothetical protein VLU46_13185 [Thermoanaerobaculia bacterium]|nr:hypothetical protein [Thermoanaerobaculia bacterium]
MIVELTFNLIASDRTCSHREARSLVECAYKAILEIYPAFHGRYDRVVRPAFERILQQRWPEEELHVPRDSEVVN